MIDAPFAYSSNGTGFIEHDRTVTHGTVERELAIDELPGPEELWGRYKAVNAVVAEHESVVTQDYYVDASGKAPRYYQQVAINRTVEAIADGQNRILLVMATGTGKTYTAFQIIWRLWKSGKKKRILFLADRNVLVDQTKVNDFKPFESAMTKITHRVADPSYEIYLALYQAVTGPEEEKKIYRNFSKDFFDLIVVDECHRGSAADDSAWREILEYFDCATQIGMTATPRETEYVSNINYFGKPLYTYSLRQGIEDGFLAPYKVVRIDIDKDLTGWRPPEGKVDKNGELIEDRIYNQKDFDRSLILEKRTQLVANKVSDFLKATDRFDKTIVFCEDIDHAERMRQALVNENADLVNQNSKYVMRITGDEQIGKAELDNFIDPAKRYPVIATTSKLLSTGVDVQTCKLIVLDQRIQSLSMFKQIIGRGTRIKEEYGKLFFTILDFKKATELFADPDFDGDPVQIYPPPPEEQGGPKGPITEVEPPVGPPREPGHRVKYYVDDVEVHVIAERVQYYDRNGKLITESLKDYTRANVLRDYDSLDSFLQRWTDADKKQTIIDELCDRGVFLDALADEVGKDYDPFDLVCHVAFDRPPLTRRERAENVRKQDYFAKYNEPAQAVLNALLDKYADGGITQIEDINVLRVSPLTDIGTPVEIMKRFGSRENLEAAIRELEEHLYAA
jgi:type I restriction enzyme R subunit